MATSRLVLLIVSFIASTITIHAVAFETGRENRKEAVREAVMNFINAIDKLDVDGVAASFTEDATAFYPFSFTPARLNGRDAIAREQSRGFDWATEQLAASGKKAPYALGLNPTDMEIRMIGDEAAVVTWHSNRPTHAGRRTSVLQRVDGEWLTVSHHASNMASQP